MSKTSEQIEEAKKNIAEKGEDSQTEKDREDESVAMQEHDDGNEDSQSAKDRIDEHDGEEKALEHEDEHEEHKEEHKNDLATLMRSIEEIRSAVSELRKQFAEDDGRKVRPATDKDAIAAAESIYNN